MSSNHTRILFELGKLGLDYESANQIMVDAVNSKPTKVGISGTDKILEYDPKIDGRDGEYKITDKPLSADDLVARAMDLLAAPGFPAWSTDKERRERWMADANRYIASHIEKPELVSHITHPIGTNQYECACGARFFSFSHGHSSFKPAVCPDSPGYKDSMNGPCRSIP